LWDKLSEITTLLKLPGKLERNVHLKGEVVLDAREQARATARKMSTEQLAEIVTHLDAIAAIEARLGVHRGHSFNVAMSATSSTNRWSVATATNESAD
jgi:hypothetical protein